MIIKKLYIFIFAAAAAGCTRGEPEEMPPPRPAQTTAAEYRVPVGRAVETAGKLLGMIAEPGTRCAPAAAASVQAVGYAGGRFLAAGGAGSVRSGGDGGEAADTLLYLINYEDGGGFALMGADTRLEPVYAISDEGSMYLSDTAQNRGLAIFMDGVRCETLAALQQFEARKDVHVTDHEHYTEPEPWTFSKMEILHKRGPYDKNRRWGQREPFNSYCPVINGQHALVGCTAVGTAMILGHFRYPEYMEGVKINWRGLDSVTYYGGTPFARDQAAWLMAVLGKKYLNMKYGLDGSRASSMKAISTFWQLGYDCPDDLTKYDTAAVRKHFLEKSSPIYMEGWSWNANTGRDSDGHVWILDGSITIWYLFEYRDGSDPVTSFMEFSETYYHCNWGWGGTANGWYLRDAFNPGIGPQKTDPGESFSTVGYDFEYRVRMINNIEPKKR